MSTDRENEIFGIAPRTLRFIEPAPVLKIDERMLDLVEHENHKIEHTYPETILHPIRHENIKFSHSDSEQPLSRFAGQVPYWPVFADGLDAAENGTVE